MVEEGKHTHQDLDSSAWLKYTTLLATRKLLKEMDLDQGFLSNDKSLLRLVIKLILSLESTQRPSSYGISYQAAYCEICQLLLRKNIS